MSSVFLSGGGSSSIEFTNGTGALNVASAVIQGLGANLPVKTTGTKQLTSGLINLADCSFVPAVSPVPGTWQAREFTGRYDTVPYSVNALYDQTQGIATKTANQSAVAGVSTNFTGELQENGNPVMSALEDASGLGVSLLDVLEGPTASVKTLQAGTGIGLADLAGSITISNSGVLSVADSGGGGASLIAAGSAPTPTTKSLVAGAGVALTPAANTITIANSGVITLAGAGAGVSLVATGATAATTKGLAVDSTLALSASADTVNISASASQTAAMAAAADSGRGGLPAGVRSTWLATAGGAGQASSAYSSQFSRWIGAGVASGVRYSGDAWATSTAASGAFTANLLKVGCDGADLFCARAYTGAPEAWYSGDGINWLAAAAPPSTASFFGNIAWSPGAALFVCGSGAAATIETSPSGVVWTSRATATRQTAAVVSAGGSRVVAVGSGGPMYSSDGGATWTNSASSVSMSWAMYSPELSLIVATPGASSVFDLYTSADFGATWSTLAGANPTGSLIRAGMWVASKGRFQFHYGTNSNVGQIGTLTYAEILANSPMVCYSAVSAQSNLTGGNETYTAGYDVPLDRFFINGNGGGTGSWYTVRDSNVNAGTALAAGTGTAGALAGALVILKQTLATPATYSTRGTLAAELGYAGSLMYRFGGVSFPLVGPALKQSRRFDATLAQTFMTGASGFAFKWDAVNRQPRFSFASVPVFGSSSIWTNTYFSFSVTAPSTSASNNAALVAATDYYVESAAVARTAGFDMNKATSMVWDSYLSLGTVGTATVPSWRFRIHLVPGNVGLYICESLGSPV